jgi:hypothetical protein
LDVSVGTVKIKTGLIGCDHRVLTLKMLGGKGAQSAGEKEGGIARKWIELIFD